MISAEHRTEISENGLTDSLEIIYIAPISTLALGLRGIGRQADNSRGKKLVSQ